MELKDELAVTNDKLVATMEELADTKEELAHTKKDLNAALTNLTNVTITTKDKLKMLEKEVTILRDPPFLHMCGSNSGSLSGIWKHITYDKLFYSSTNTEG